jgi:hypothetical protein
MARAWQDVERNIRWMNDLLATVGTSVEQVVRAYPDSEFLLRLLGLGNGWSESDRKTLESRIAGTHHHRDSRDNRVYAASIVLGWVMEDIVVQLLQSAGYTCERTGADAKRELLPASQISGEPDLKLINKQSEVWWLDVLMDYPTRGGAASYWQEKFQCDLRDEKFNRLAEKVKERQGRAGLIGISVGTKNYFGLEITTDLIQALESPPECNEPIYRIETHWPFGGKPAIALNLRLLQVEFHPFVELPKGLPFAAD